MKILIIQQKMIGDVLTTSILFEALRNKYPKAKLDYLINTHTIPVVENNPYIDNFIIYTKEIENSKLALLKFAKSLKNKDYNIVIDVYSKLSSNIISFYSNAKTKISYYKYYTSFLYNYNIIPLKHTSSNAGLAIINRLLLLEPIFNKQTKPIQPKIYLTKKEIKNTEVFLTANKVDLKKPLFMISVLGSDISKTYPFKYMAKIIDTIVDTVPNSQLLFNYIPSQLKDAKTIYNLCTPNTQKHIMLNVYGKNLREFICITHFCSALIGNEGGAVNMAKALNIPTFTIFSPWINKNAWSLFENKTTNISVHLKDVDPKLYSIYSLKKIRKNHKTFYQFFKPNYITNLLTNFLIGLKY